MDKLECLQQMWVDNEAEIREDNTRYTAQKCDICDQIIALSKYKVGDKVKYTRPRDWRNREIEPMFGIIAEVVARSNYDEVVFPQYIVHKINKNGSMHKTANITYGPILEKDLEVVE